MVDVSDPRMKEWATVLNHAHELLLKDKNIPMGLAIRRAVEAADVEVPEEVQERMLIMLFKLCVNGFPTKVEA